MITISWEETKQEQNPLLQTIIKDLKNELSIEGKIIVVHSGYRIELKQESELTDTLEAVSTVMNQNIENGPDGWMASHTEDSISVAIR